MKMSKTSLEGHAVILLQLVSLEYINDRIIVTARNKGYVFTGVCDSVHRESLSQHAPHVTLPGGSLSRAVSVQGGLCPGGLFPVWGGLCFPPYGNERAVRILLECILVVMFITRLHTKDSRKKKNYQLRRSTSGVSAA